MPTYEYACKACDHNFEIVQSFSEDSLTTCPACEQDALRKVYNAAGIIFKGDGWHSKDYASSGAGSTPTSTDDAATTSDGGSEDTPAKKQDKTPKKGTKGGSGSGSSAAKPAAS